MSGAVLPSRFGWTGARLHAGWRRFAPSRLGVAGLAVVVVFLVLAMAAPWLVPYDPLHIDTTQRLLPPSTTYWLGTDDRGRDTFSRTLLGTRITLYIVLLSILITTPIGMLIGCLAGYVGGLVETVLIRVTDIFLAFPALILAMAFAAALGSGIEHAVMAIALASWPALARLAYAETLRVRSAEYIWAIRLQGASLPRVLLLHIVPMCIPVLLVRVMLGVSNTILTAASLGFLGLGTQPPTPEWGAMLAEGRRHVADGWWLIAAPGGAIVIVSVAFNLLGDGLRDALDPRRR